jgi:hypothetical protein
MSRLRLETVGGRYIGVESDASIRPDNPARSERPSRIGKATSPAAEEKMVGD